MNKLKTMDTTLKPILLIILAVLLFSCKKDDIQSVKTMDSFKGNSYYSQEIVPAAFNSLYGKWGLEAISGGFTGGGHELNYRFLYLKPYGIYGITKTDSDTLIEYGRFETDTINQDMPGMLKLKFIPDHYSETSLISPPEKYAYLSNDSLVLYSPCCDMYNYHYIRYRED